MLIMMTKRGRKNSRWQLNIKWSESCVLSGSKYRYWSANAAGWRYHSFFTWLYADRMDMNIQSHLSPGITCGNFSLWNDVSVSLFFCRHFVFQNSFRFHQYVPISFCRVLAVGYGTWTHWIYGLFFCMYWNLTRWFSETATSSSFLGLYRPKWMLQRNNYLHWA